MARHDAGMTAGVVGGCGRRGLLRAAGLLVVLAGLPACALGQLVPPPTEAPAPTPIVTPTPLPPSVVAQQEEAARARQSAAERARAEAERQKAMQDLPNLPYDSLVKRDESGTIIVLNGNAHLLALSVNPLMDDSLVERCQGVIAERRSRMEAAVIKNIDLIQKVLDGVIENADLNDRAGLGAMLAVVQPFQEMGHLTEDLKAQGYLTDQQYGFNWKIVREYEQARQQETMAAAAANEDENAPNPMLLVTRQIMTDFMREPMAVYHSMLLEGAGRIDAAMAGITLEGDGAGRAGRLVAAIKSAPSDDARLASARELTGLMTPAQKGQLLQNVIDSR